MRKWRFAALFLLFQLALTPDVKAGNEHEHLQYLPGYEDIQSAFKGELTTLPAGEVFGKSSFHIIQQIFGNEVIAKLFPEVSFYQGQKFDEVLAKAEVDRVVANSTFGGLCERIAETKILNRSTIQVLRSFFDLSESNGNALEKYLAIAQVRNRLFELHPDSFLDSMKSYLSHATRSDLLKTGFSIPKYMAKKELLSTLQEMYRAKGAQVNFYVSVPRSWLTQSDFSLEDELFKISRPGFREGWIQGIDIAGSVVENEASYKNPKKIEKTLKKNIEKLFHESQQNSMPIRVHAFEAGREGVFYDAFWQSLDSCRETECFARQLRIGHIQALEKSDIQRFAKLKDKMQIVFEANIESNLQVQKASEIQKLVQTIEDLHQEGFRVVLGSDGLGVLGEDASFEGTLRLLKENGLSERSLKTIVKNAHLPVQGTRIPKTQLLDWQDERAGVQNRLLENSNGPGRSCGEAYQLYLQALFKH